MIPQNDNAIIPITEASRLPNDLWRTIMAYLMSQDREADVDSLATVSKQLLALWREGALILHIPLNHNGPQDLADRRAPDAIDNGALDSIEEGALSTFPNAYLVIIQVERSVLQWPGGYNHRIAERGFPPPEDGMSIDLRLANTTSFKKALQVMKACPAVASLVNLLSVVEVDTWPQEIAIEEVWELIECLPNLKALTLRDVDLESVDSAWLLRLATLEGLCHLGVNLDCDFAPQGLEGLASSSLQSLCLTNVQSPAGLLEHIAKMPKLKWLKLELPLPDNKIAELLAKASFDQVEYLDIWSNAPARPLLDAVARSFPKVKDLTLAYFDDIAHPRELESLCALASLEYLGVGYVSNVDQGAVHNLASKMPKLRKLGIRCDQRQPLPDIKPASNREGESVSIRLSW